MSRRSNQKLKLLYLSKIMLEQTDKQHGLTLNEIKNELAKYGVFCERKCLYDDMEALRLFGIDIAATRDRYVRYYVATKKLKIAELKFIIDFLEVCNYLPLQNQNELMSVLTELGCSKSSMSKLSTRQEGLILNDIQIEQAYKNITLICEAILQNKKISFKYFEWNSHKQRILTNNGEFFSVSPLKLVLKNKKYVLIAYDDKCETTLEFFVQRIINPTISTKAQEKPELAEDRTQKEFLRFKAKNSFAGDVFEYFGLDITILSNRDDYFEFSAKTDITEKLLSWVFINGKSIKIISPENVVKQFNDLINYNQNDI